jgi:drug/metabolite transporter (DMT)-like permease
VVLYQALLGAVAHIWWYRAVEVVGASRAGIFLSLQPVVGLVLAAGLLGERIGLGQVVGTACVLGGVALTTRGPGVRRRQG